MNRPYSGKVLLWIFVTTCLIGCYNALINPPTNPEVRHKLDLIKHNLTEAGYHNRYFVISGKRSGWYNSLLPAAAKKSFHLMGKAIDIMVIDINGDWRFNEKDIAILEKINAQVEKENPELLGAFGTYRQKGGLFAWMVHLDTRGYKRRYDQ